MVRRSQVSSAPVWAGAGAGPAPYLFFTAENGANYQAAAEGCGGQHSSVSVRPLGLLPPEPGAQGTAATVTSATAPAGRRRRVPRRSATTCHRGRRADVGCYN